MMFRKEDTLWDIIHTTNMHVLIMYTIKKYVIAAEVIGIKRDKMVKTLNVSQNA